MPEAAVAPEAPSAPSLADDLAEMFGDIPEKDVETPEPETETTPGTTPEAETAGTETGAEAAALPGAAPGETTSPPATEEQDPLADTTPATFNVNGKPVTNEDIRVFKEGGAVIRPESLPNVLNKLSERESLFERNRAQSQEYQTLAKLAEWTDTESGKTFTGPEALIELRIGNSALLAENKLLVETLLDPDRLYSILATEQVPDGKGGLRERVVISPQALRNLQTENENQRLKLTNAIRSHFQGVIAETQRPATASIDYSAITPTLVQEVAKQANLDASALSAADLKVLAEQLPFHIRDGLASVAWQNLVKTLIQDRVSHKATTQSVAVATEKAAREGAARMAAAARGIKPRTTATPIATQPKTPQISERAQADSDAWDIMESAASRAMRR